MKTPILDHGFLECVETWGSDERIVEAARPQSEYWQALPLALERGYRIDPDTGEVFWLNGERLSTKRAEGQQYPTVRFYVLGLSRPDYSVPVHKAVAYVIWGWAAFAPDIEVRHLDGNTENNTRQNLALGTSSRNQFDKPPEIRAAAAKAARAAQPLESFNAILTEEKAAAILADCNENRVPSGRVRRGVAKRLAAKHGVSVSTISLIGKGKTWKR